MILILAMYLKEAIRVDLNWHLARTLVTVTHIQISSYWGKVMGDLASLHRHRLLSSKNGVPIDVMK
jgi:hypothetical protein